MWIYTDLDDAHRVQIKEREEFKKNDLAPIKERYLRENTWISDFSNFKDQDDLEKKQVRYSRLCPSECLSCVWQVV